MVCNVAVAEGTAHDGSNHSVIMCGGAGTRLWPVSRESMPKQFVPLSTGVDVQLVLAAHFGSRLFARPIVITNADFRSWWRSSCASAASKRTSCRAVRRDSVRRSGCPPCSRPTRCEALVLDAGGDHVVRQPERFREAVARSRRRRRRPASSPSASSPTIRQRLRLHRRREAQRRVVRGRGIRGKADAATRRVTWPIAISGTAGNFLFHARPMLGEIERFEPAMAEPRRRRSVASRATSISCGWLPNRSRVRQESIDYASWNVPSSAAWFPPTWLVGCRKLEHGLGHLDHDQVGNATDGPVVMLDSRNCLVRSEDFRVDNPVVGLDDVIVVSTADAVLVSARAAASR